MGNPAAGWTPERRRKQSQAIRAWRPWEKSTGPKSPEGKARVADNATKHGGNSAQSTVELRQIRALLAECAQRLQ